MEVNHLKAPHSGGAGIRSVLATELYWRNLGGHYMKIFYVLISAFWPHSAFKLRRMVAVLFMALSVAGTMHAQSANPVSISPSSGSGSVQSFVATYTDRNSAMDIQSLSLFILNGVAPDSKSGWSANACILNYTIGSGVIQLLEDTGGHSSPIQPSPELIKR
jgi:hypothetical protein